MSEYEVQGQDEQEATQKSEIQARREARRRKILENSKLRLEKLNGRISTGNSTETQKLTNSSRTYSDPEMETEEMFGFNPNLLFQTGIKSDLDQQQFLGDQLFVKNLENMQNKNWQQSQSSQQQATSDSKLKSTFAKILKSKLHLIVLSLFTYGFIEFGDRSFSSYSIFLPLLVWELTEAIVIKPKENNTSEALLNLVLLMVGIPQAVSQPFLKITGTLNKVFKDVGVFVFSFVICHAICIQFVSVNTESPSEFEDIAVEYTQT